MIGTLVAYARRKNLKPDERKWARAEVRAWANSHSDEIPPELIADAFADEPIA